MNAPQNADGASVDHPDLTGDRLRMVADTLDALDTLAHIAYTPFSEVEGDPHDTVTITLRLNSRGRLIDPESATAIVDAVGGSGMQDTLRWWAGQMEAGRLAIRPTGTLADDERARAHAIREAAEALYQSGTCPGEYKCYGKTGEHTNPYCQMRARTMFERATA